ncbi:MAG: ankyrin repeat domain-containing protein [Candidatus Methylomirabilis sp.]|nr:ankyrin repeat domain-containing protein [Candidatus Methylomirabilis sp.]
MGFFGSLFQAGGTRDDKLIEASKSGAAADVKRLLAEGADANARDPDGWTALIHASWLGYVEIANLLLNKGADVNASARNSVTPLMYASWHGHGGGCRAPARSRRRCERHGE